MTKAAAAGRNPAIRFPGPRLSAPTGPVPMCKKQNFRLHFPVFLGPFFFFCRGGGGPPKKKGGEKGGGGGGGGQRRRGPQRPTAASQKGHGSQPQAPAGLRQPGQPPLLQGQQPLRRGLVVAAHQPQLSMIRLGLRAAATRSRETFDSLRPIFREGEGTRPPSRPKRSLRIFLFPFIELGQPGA